MGWAEPQISFHTLIPAKVLGCLKRGEITVILSPGHGIVEAEPISVEWIPIDLRMPNSEFDILMKFPAGEIVRVVRKDEFCPEIQKNYG